MVVDIIEINQTFMKPKCCEERSNTDLFQTVEFLKVISEENRLRILCILKKKQELCVCEIWQCLDLPQNLASHHLKVLKDFGLILSRQEGLKVFYSLNKKHLKDYSKLLNNYLK